MEKELLLGVLFCAIGSILNARPELFWNMASKHSEKAEDGFCPSGIYMICMHLMTFIFLGVGVFLTGTTVFG